MIQPTLLHYGISNPVPMRLRRGVSLPTLLEELHMTDNQPVHKETYGQIQTSIWRNEKEEFTSYSASITKRYKDGDDWKSTTNFNVNDLPKLELAARKSYEKILELNRKKE